MTNKITKTMKLAAIKNILLGDGSPLADGMTMDMLVEYCDREMEILSKKTSGKTKAQIEADMTLQTAILDTMGTMEDGVTTTAIADAVKGAYSEYANLSTSKTTAMLGALAKDGKVYREVVKGKALYSLI